MTRLDAFDTKTLPKWLMKIGASEHFREHAMEHLHWMATYISGNRNLVRNGELFYERGIDKGRGELDLAREKRKQELRSQRLFTRSRGIRQIDALDRIHQV